MAKFITLNLITFMPLSRRRPSHRLCSYVGEERTISAYNTALQKSFDLGKRGGTTKGVGVGYTCGLLFGVWASLLWNASTPVIYKATTVAYVRLGCDLSSQMLYYVKA
ncbi:hypothetical protein GOP47_0020186 [Adiantum capillus-veneris]|uniref:Uncharacterized protein n=1 Tax=Adiantum capillus-veneris TaxID=13818 RepID=A0A9D4UE22_ADICA|nr:hypothetical protein GOP47_0020186 [Adiantum capillus-veneris]